MCARAHTHAYIIHADHTQTITHKRRRAYNVHAHTQTHKHTWTARVDKSKSTPPHANMPKIKDTRGQSEDVFRCGGT